MCYDWGDPYSSGRASATVGITARDSAGRLWNLVCLRTARRRYFPPPQLRYSHLLLSPQSIIDDMLFTIAPACVTSCYCFRRRRRRSFL